MLGFNEFISISFILIKKDLILRIDGLIEGAMSATISLSMYCALNRGIQLNCLYY